MILQTRVEVKEHLVKQQCTVSCSSECSCVCRGAAEQGMLCEEGSGMAVGQGLRNE